MRTKPYQSVTNSDINIGVVSALVDEDNTIFGVIGADITLRNLTDHISEFNVGYGGHDGPNGHDGPVINWWQRYWVDRLHRILHEHYLTCRHAKTQHKTLFGRLNTHP